MRRFILVLLSCGLAVAVTACSSADKDKRTFLASGDRYVAQAKDKEAIIEYRNAIQRDPRFGDARLKLAQAYERTGDLLNAYREYVRAADLLPANDDAQLKAGSYLFLARQFEDAKARATRVLERSPKNVKAHILLGNALAGLKDLDAAVSAMETAAADGGGSAVARTNIGYLEYARGNKAEAERAFTQAIESDATSVDARLALANFYMADGRLDDAERTLKEALAINPRDALANRALAAFYVAAQRAPDAEPYVKAAADAVGDTSSKLMLADYYTQSNRDDEAAAVLQPLLAAASSFGLAATRLADIDRRHGRAAPAYARLAEVLKRDARNTHALLTRARLRIDDKQVPDAVTDLRAALAIDPSSAQAHLLLAATYQSVDSLDQAAQEYREALKLAPGSVKAEYELARISLSTGRLDAATEYASQARAGAPRDFDVRLVYARTLAATHQADRAASELRALAEQSPDNADVRAALGSLMAGERQVAEARRWYEAALALDAKNVEAVTGLANLDIDAKRGPEARERLDARIAATPSDPTVSLVTAASYLRMGDAPRAEQLLLKTIESDPSRMAAYLLLGRIYISQKRLDEAKKQFETLLSRQQAPVGSATMLGIILESQGKPADAAKMYEHALEIDATAPVAANNLAWMYAHNGGNLDVALQLAQTAKQKLPDEPEIDDTLGWVYYKKGVFPQALTAFEQAVAHSPGSAQFHLHLGLARINAGDTERGRNDLLQALKLNPNVAGADEARRLLASPAPGA